MFSTARSQLAGLFAVALVGIMLVVPAVSASAGSPAADTAKKHKKHKKHKKAKCASLCANTFQTIVAKIDSEIVRMAPSLNVGHAASADNATNAAKLGGSPASAFETAGHFLTSGVVALNTTGTQNMLTVGPITFAERCTDQGSGSFKAEILESSSEAGTILAGPNGSDTLGPAPKVETFATGTGASAIDFATQILTPSGFSFQENEFAGVHSAGHNCVARVNAFVP